MKKSRYFLLFFLVFAAGCLKTRSQVKDDGSDSDSGAPAHAKPVDNGRYAVDELKSEVTALTGRLEDMERAQRDSNSGSKESEERFRKLEERMNEQEKAQAAIIEALKKVEREAPKDKSALYKKAKALYDAKKWEEAADGFSDYLDSGDSEHAQVATFMRGDSYFNLKEYKKAIIDYSKFPEKYTSSKRVPEALLKIGMSFENLGMKEDAKTFYQELIDKYPKSAESKTARKKIGSGGKAKRM